MILDRRTLPVLAVVAICTLPHFANVAPWVVAVCLFLWTYTGLAIHRGWTLPGRLSKTTAATLLSLLAMTSHEGLTIEAFVALLTLMISLKVLENQGGRERMVTVILCYFLLVGSLFFNDSILATGYMVFAVLSTTAIMIYLNHPQGGIRPSLRLSATLMLQALPIMLVMFFLFPRIPGGLWGRTPINSGRTGFSDAISFGAIARLAQNHSVAFRVEFADKPPARDKLYWRGIVLWFFDGTTWQRGRDRWKTPPSLEEKNNRINYTLTLEPHNEHWLITLDLPMSVSYRRSWFLNDHTSYSWRPISQRIAYEGVSYLEAGTSGQPEQQHKGLQLPATGNPRSRELAASWASEADDPAKRVALALDYFRQHPFVYTLTPGSLDSRGGGGEGLAPNLVDRFLFDSRRGFCEHYACSFAFLMRAAGVPARIVAGYQGGSVNRYGGYLVVRQSDAHAWCEVWLPAQGWVRVDPTAVVAPGRIEHDATTVLPAGELPPAWSFLKTGPLAKWLEPVTGAWDLLNSRWNRWVMGYSLSEQLNLFSRLGIRLSGGKDLAKRFGLFLAAALPLLLLAGFLISRRKQVRKDKVAACWLDFCRRVEKIGLARPPAQGPRDYMHHILQQRPDLKLPIEAIIRRYISLRYSGQPKAEDVRELEILVKRFRPKKQATRQHINLAFFC